MRAPLSTGLWCFGVVKALLLRRVLAGTVLLGTVACAAAQTAVPEAAVEQWQGEQQTRVLKDSSTLVEYISHTQALSPEGFQLQVSFLPRFGCEPLVSVLALPDASSAPESSAGSAAQALAMREFRIDGEAVELPTIVEEKSEHTALHFQAPAATARALREQIDTGNLAFLVTDADITMAFSLFGSSRSLAAVQAQCLLHEPEPAAGPDAG